LAPVGGEGGSYSPVLLFLVEFLSMAAAEDATADYLSELAQPGHLEWR